jgi:hypothetical protein
MILENPQIIGLIIVLALVAVGYAIYRGIWMAPGGQLAMRTDEGRPISDPTKADSFDTPVPGAPDADTQKKDKDRGRLLVGHAEKKCNCVGFSLGRGNWVIGTEDFPRIIEDNYSIVEGKARICNVIIYGNPENGYDHIGLVVEVTADGKPKRVRSKTTISDFVYDDPPDVEPFGADYKVYERKSTDKLPPEQKKEIKKLQDEYDRIKDKGSKEARNKAARLCQEKNALLGAEVQ